MKEMPEVERGRIDCLDGIRGVAALMVMVFHFVGSHGEALLIRKLAVIGQTGVDLFFVLSGFLITGILLNSKGKSAYFRSFYARRVLRIFPLYYGYLVVHFFVLPTLLSQPAPLLHQQLWSWLFLENVPATFPSLGSRGPAHFWSLAVEEHFYLLWPLLVFLLSRRSLARILLCTILVSPLIRLLFLWNGVDVFFLTVTRIDAISLGAYLAILQSRGWLESRRSVWLLRALALALPIFLIPLFVVFSGSGEAWLQAIKLSLIPAFYFSVVGICIGDRSAAWLSNMFSVRLLRWTGSISFGLYVFHPASFDLVRRFVPHGSVYTDFTLSFAFAFAVAWISFRFYETPFLRLKQYFKNGDPLVTRPLTSGG